MDPRIVIVAAVAENGVIGRNGELPWYLKSDFQRFRTLTDGQTALMGRRTFESIVARLGHPLPNRTSIVLTTANDYVVPPGCEVRHSLDEVLATFPSDGRPLFVIGGSRVFDQAFLRADEMHLTIVHARPEGDVFFPSRLAERFVMTESHRFTADPPANNHDYTFSIYHRVLPPPGFVCLENARTPQQWSVMERIQLDGVCPFCPNSLARYHNEPIILENEHWLLTKNRWPYENTKHHFLVIARRHAEQLSQLTSDAWSALGSIVSRAEQTYQMFGGGLALRFGEPYLNRGTVRHLHVQLLSVDTIDTKRPEYKPVRFRLG